MAFHVKETGMLFCDSDMFFVKPFDVSRLNHERLFRFYCRSVVLPEHTSITERFSKGAAKILGLSQKTYDLCDYVNNMVTWHVPTAQALCAYIAETSGQDWKVAVSRFKIYSEYTLYGLFLDNISDDRNQFEATDECPCATAWGKNYVEDFKLDEFFNSLAPHQVAVGIQSFIGVSVDILRSRFHHALKKFN
jgi:Family of unknown function (DUF6492)